MKMATRSKSQTQQCSRNILELPEIVFREIFKSLDIETLYFKMRKVNQEIESYIDGYLKLKGIFIVHGKPEGVPKSQARTELMSNMELHKVIYIFKMNNANIDIYTSYKDLRARFQQNDNKRYKKLNVPKFVAPLNDRNMIAFGSELNKDKSSLYVYSFDTKTSTWWKAFLKIPTHLSIREFKGLIQIGDSQLLCLYKGPGDDGSCCGYFYRWGELRQLLLSLNENPPKRGNEKIKYCFNEGIVPCELKSLDKFTLVRVAKETIMLIGGYQLYAMQNFHGCNHNNASNDGLITFKNQGPFKFYKPNELVWKGTLTQCGKSVTWEKQDLGRIKMRIKPICFKLKDNLYIAGANPKPDNYDENQCGWPRCCQNPHFGYYWMEPDFCKTCNQICVCCDKYDMKEGKYYHNVYSLPYPLTFYNHVKVATYENEEFALLVICNQDRDSSYDPVISPQRPRKYTMLAFTEDEGFQDVSYKQFEKLHILEGTAESMKFDYFTNIPNLQSDFSSISI